METEDALKRAYDLYTLECESALRLTVASIENIRAAFRNKKGRDPINRILSRIKTFESSRDKCVRRNYDLNMENVRKNIKDVAGVRIIIEYLDEIPKVVEVIRKLRGIEVISLKDYVKKPKPSGYRSVHLCCMVEVYDPYIGLNLIPLEIQLRTEAMNYWAECQHKIYKYKNPPLEVVEELKKMAEDFARYDIALLKLKKYEKTAEINKEAVILSEFCTTKIMTPNANLVFDEELKPKATATFLA